MDSLEDLALLGAVGVPIALVALANIYLALTGESGTLLLPSRRPLAPPEPAGEAAPEPSAAGEARSAFSAFRRFRLARRRRHA